MKPYGVTTLFSRLRPFSGEKPDAKKEGELYTGMAKTMESWETGLFVTVKSKAGQKMPIDNLELERWFRQPKRHERRIHGRKHAGVRLVQQGATLMAVLDAHKDRPGPYQAEELLGYQEATLPKQEQEALHRHQVMRQARSRKRRAALLAELERRYQAVFS